MKPDLYRLVLGAGGTAWAPDADLDLGLRPNHAVNCYRALREFGENEHASGLFGSARHSLRRLRKTRHRWRKCYPQQQEKSGSLHHSSDACFLLSTVTPIA
jgi:hypothetical protein